MTVCWIKLFFNEYFLKPENDKTRMAPLKSFFFCLEFRVPVENLFLVINSLKFLKKPPSSSADFQRRNVAQNAVHRLSPLSVGGRLVTSLSAQMRAEESAGLIENEANGSKLLSLWLSLEWSATVKNWTC